MTAKETIAELSKLPPEAEIVLPVYDGPSMLTNFILSKDGKTIYAE